MLLGTDHMHTFKLPCGCILRFLMVSCWCRSTLLSTVGLAPPLLCNARIGNPIPTILCQRLSYSSSSFFLKKYCWNGLNRQVLLHSSPPKYAFYISASKMDGPPAGYRANVGICLINSENQVFVASRLDVPGAWQMPQGGVDEGEEPRAAAIRELREETGVTSAEVIAEVPHWLTYDFPPAVKEKVNRLWGGDWKGQAQKWFLFKFTGDEKEINLAGDGTEAAEFSEWMWLPSEQVIEQAVDFKRPVYEQVFTIFTPHLGTGTSGS